MIDIHPTVDGYCTAAKTEEVDAKASWTEGGEKMYKAIIIYETRTGNTEVMAHAILPGLTESGIQVTLKRIMDDIDVKELAGFDAVVLGSPTHNHDVNSLVKEFLLDMSKTDLKGKIGAAFGSYGWTGEAVQMITETMKQGFSMDVIEPGLRLKYVPDERDLEECKNFGKRIAERIKNRL